MCDRLWYYLRCLCCCCCRRVSKMKSKSRRTLLSIGTEWESLPRHDGPIFPDHIKDEYLTERITTDLPQRGDTDISSPLAYDRAVLKLKNYEMMNNGMIIGKGGFAQVYQVVDTNGVILAAKVMEFSKSHEIKPGRYKAFKHEVVILKRHSHPNIIKVVDHFIADKVNSFIIMEYASGGTLEQKLKDRNNKSFGEPVAKRYFFQMSNAIYYLHLNLIAHNDIKLSNILIFKSDSDGVNSEIIKISDFGCSRQAISDDDDPRPIVIKTKAVGTVLYMAPELVKTYLYYNMNQKDIFKREPSGYSSQTTDMWALGVCLYKMLTGHRPFTCGDVKSGRKLAEMVVRMKDGIKVNSKQYRQLSNPCLQLLMGLLEYDNKKRIDIKEVMNHKWVQSADNYDPDLIKS